MRWRYETGCGNARPDVVDYTAMRIYQRGGQNWGFSYGVGPLLLIGLLVLGAVITAFQYAWFVLVPALVALAAWAVVRLVRKERAEQEDCDFHDAEHVNGVWDEDCHWCDLETMELDLEQRREAAAVQARADGERLRANQASGSD